MTARDITEILIIFLNPYQQRFLLDNFFFTPKWEIDLLRVTRSNLIVEYEIKVSKKDFFADFKKKSKHEKLLKGVDCPNRFFYVVPEGLIDLEKIPSYAGLIEITPKEKIIIVKKAPLLHRSKVDSFLINKILERTYWRYFDLKRKYNLLFNECQRLNK